MNKLKIISGHGEAEILLNKIKNSSMMALYFIGSTKTSTIQGISIAGASPEMTLYTPALDVEYLVLGKPVTMDVIPVTPEGIPTPAIITRSALKLSNIPYLVVDTGSFIEPKIPHIKLPSRHVGNSINSGYALPYDIVKNLYNESRILADMLQSSIDTFIIGESIPGGTTTALGILIGLGYEAWGLVSSSGPNNPHRIREKVIREGLTSSGLNIKKEIEVFKAVSVLGDPLHISIAGFVSKALESNKKVILAGGTQMAAILAILRYLDIDISRNILISTTRWIINDNSSNIVKLVSMLYEEFPIVAVDINFSSAPYKGLHYYEEGFVKEGVGAGGTVLSAMIKGVSIDRIVKEIYNEYSRLIQYESLKNQ